MVTDTSPLVTSTGQRLGWSSSLTHVLILGQSGSGKSMIAQALIADIAYKSKDWPKDKQPLLIACDPKSEDWLFAESSPNCFFGDDSYKAIELAYNEMLARKADRSRPRPSLILFCEELTSLVESLSSKQKKETQHQLKLILLQGRSIGIRFCCVSQDLMAEVLGNSSLRNQFGAVLGLGSMASRSAIASSIYDLEPGQKLATLPKQQGWWQVFDGSPPIHVKVGNIRDFSRMQAVLLEMLNRYQHIEQAR
ncbi:TPA: ATP-binding protein [Streptococcus suis]|nr:ATP-binding protein [Streptococcus suis]